MYIAIIDYNMGNISSVKNALKRQGAEVRVTSDIAVINKAAGVVLPGVGAFSDAMNSLTRLGLKDTIRDLMGRKPFLGICLGFQLLFEYSMEDGKTRGLGVFKGVVERIPAIQKVPHMGWNLINIVKPNPLFEGIESGQHFYFVHSYHVAPHDRTIISSTTNHGIDIVAGINQGLAYAFQFHPEKSSTAGLRILENFIKLTVREQ
ncbi:MAG: imidazole glycerol phosphate synthase subunit HisH [Actinomycetia bacterium]|nr:imidazole glycerol phosphate synthase subunit HisH [Actinomycetes bacterium]